MEGTRTEKKMYIQQQYTGIFFLFFMLHVEIIYRSMQYILWQQKGEREGERKVECHASTYERKINVFTFCTV